MSMTENRSGMTADAPGKRRATAYVRGALVCVAAFSFVYGQQAALKNLSVNKNDVIDSLWQLQTQKTYPHARSNSECRGEPWFRARCAISDTLVNTGHGQGFPSWGPEEVAIPWWEVDFGKQVVIDSVVIFIRADFPHDGYFCKGRFVFSDNTRINITLDSTAKPQSFRIPSRVTTYLRIDSLLWHVSATWCAITQVQAFGTDNVTGAKMPGNTWSLTKANSHHALRVNGISRLAGASTETSVYALFDLRGREIRLSYPAIASMENCVAGTGGVAHNCFILRVRKLQAE